MNHTLNATSSHCKGHVGRTCQATCEASRGRHKRTLNKTGGRYREIYALLFSKEILRKDSLNQSRDRWTTRWPRKRTHIAKRFYHHHYQESTGPRWQPCETQPEKPSQEISRFSGRLSHPLRCVAPLGEGYEGSHVWYGLLPYSYCFPCISYLTMLL